MPSHAARALSLFQSILMSLGQSINHDNALYISNYYINIFGIKDEIQQCGKLVVIIVDCM